MKYAQPNRDLWDIMSRPARGAWVEIIQKGKVKVKDGQVAPRKGRVG